MYELSKNNGIVSSNTRIHCLEDIDEYDDTVVYRDIVNADSEVDNVKKLVRKMINNDRDGNQNDYCLFVVMLTSDYRLCYY